VAGKIWRPLLWRCGGVSGALCLLEIFFKIEGVGDVDARDAGKRDGECAWWGLGYSIC